MNSRTAYSFGIISSVFVCNLAVASPQDGQVSAGYASISHSGNSTTINQTSSSAVINWHSFDTTSTEYVNFNQPNANSTVLNRITSGLPTNFAGTLSANGKVFIVNPAGMVFVAGSHVNTSGFVASTADIKTQDFMNGNYRFASSTSKDSASIINNGNIKTDNSGVVALIAPNVVNSQTGIIQANLGKVALASGKTFVLDFNQDNLINFDVSAAVKNGRVINNGIINATGGKVFMTANTVGEVLDSVMGANTIQQAGRIIVGQDGSVVLDAGNSGSIAERADAVIDAGTLKTNSAMGTVLESNGNRINKFSAKNSTSGDIRLKNTGDLVIKGITQTGGNLKITNTGFISQPYLPQTAMTVSGSSDFTGNGITLLSNNQFVGPVSFSSSGNWVSLQNSAYNIILGNVTADSLYIKNTAGSITQAPNTALNIKDFFHVTTGEAPITLANSGNKITGSIWLANSRFGNKDITLRNSADTELWTISAGGTVTIISDGLLTAGHNYTVNTDIYSYSTQAPNGHSIILSAPTVDANPYSLHPGENNSYVIFSANPDAVSLKPMILESILAFLYLLDKPVVPPVIWNTTYSVSAVNNIPTGNYVVYSDKQPK